jgi:hypothetical protein
VGTLGETVDEPLDGEVLQEFIEWAGGFLGLVEKTLMHRRGGVIVVSRHL